MEAVDRFRLHYDLPTVVREAPRPELRFDDHALPLALPPGAIAGQFSCRHGFLLLLSDAAFDGEDLHCALLSHALEPLDVVEVTASRLFGLRLLPGKLSRMRILGDDEIQFDFGYTWCVRILQQPTRLAQELWSANLFRAGAQSGLSRYLWFRRMRFSGR